jgi:hypothetical protein
VLLQRRLVLGVRGALLRLREGAELAGFVGLPSRIGGVAGSAGEITRSLIGSRDPPDDLAWIVRGIARSRRRTG